MSATARLLPQCSGLTVTGGNDGGQPPVSFLTEDALAFRCGNTLALYAVSKRDQRLLTLPAGCTLDAFASAPAVARLAVATRGHSRARGGAGDTRITIYALPGLEVVKSFAYDCGPFPITHLALSRTASRLVTVTSLLNRHLVFWDIAAGGSDSAEKLAEYWWDQSGKLAPTDPTSRDGGLSSTTPHAATALPHSQTGDSSPLTHISFNPKNHHEFVTATRRTLTWFKLVHKLDGRVLLPLECGVSSSVVRRPMAEGPTATPDHSSESAAAHADSEGTLAYLRTLSHSLAANGSGMAPMGASALHTLESTALVVPESPAELTVSFSSRVLRAAWKAGTFQTGAPSHPSSHRRGGSISHLPQVSSTATTERGANSEASTDRDVHDPSSSPRSIDDNQRSFSTANLLPLPTGASPMSASASAPVLPTEERKDGGDGGDVSHVNSSSNLKALVLLPTIPSNKSSVPPLAPMPPPSAAGGPAGGPHGRKRSVFWGAGGQGLNYPPRVAHSAREFQAQWDEEQARLLAADAQERGAVRELSSHTWSPEGQFIAGTSLGEVLVYTRGWTRSHPAPTITEEPPSPIPALHLQIHASELGSLSAPVALLSLAATRRFLLAGTSDGRVMWLEPSSGLATHTSKYMSEHGIVALSFSPSYRHFAVLDRKGVVQLASTVAATVLAHGAVPSVGIGAGMSFSTSAAVPTGRPSSGGTTSSSASMFARPFTKTAEAKEASPVASTSTSNGNQLRVSSFTLARFPLASSTDHFVELLPRTNRLVLVNTRTRELHVLNYRTREFLSSFTFPKASTSDDATAAISCISSSPDGLLVCVGFHNGYVALLDACPATCAMNGGASMSAASIGSEPLDLRVVFFEQVHLGSVHCVKFSLGGSHLFSLGRSDNFLFIFRCDHWQLSGYINSGCRDLSTRVLSAEWILVSGQNKVFLSLDDGELLIVTPPEPLYEATGSLLLPDSITQVVRASIDLAATALIGDPLNERGFFALGVDKKLRRFQYASMDAFEMTSDQSDSQVVDSDFLDTPSTARRPLITSTFSDEWSGHLKVGCVLATSPDGEWIASGGRDGLILLRRTQDMHQEPITLAAHGSIAHFEMAAPSVNGEASPKPLNGLTSLRFSSDSKLLLSAGVDGAVLAWDISSLGAPGSQHKGAQGKSFVAGSAAAMSLSSRGAQAMAVSTLKAMPTVNLDFYVWPEGPNGVHTAHCNPQIDMSHLGIVADEVTGGDDSAIPASNHAHLGPRTYLDHQFAALVSRVNDVHSEPAKLQAAIQAISKRMQEMVHANSRACQLERITDPTEFIVDVQLLTKLQRAMTTKIALTKQQIHQDNLAKELVLERVRKQCWDTLEVKGCMLRSLSQPVAVDPATNGAGAASWGVSGGGVIEVANFPLRILSATEKAVLRKVEFQRRLNVQEEAWITANPRHSRPQLDADDDEQPQAHARSSSTMTGRFGEYAATREATYILDNHNGATHSEGADDDAQVAGARAALDRMSSVAKPIEATGPREKTLGGVDRDRDADWNDEAEARHLWHPTMLFTAVRKRTQLHLLRLKADRLKRKFNAAFNALHDQKKELVELIRHKGERMAELQAELELDPAVYTPILAADELPSSILTVADSEVRVAKVLSAAEAGERSKELAARVKDANDEANLRALDDMMNGSLEKRRDLSSLASELVRPHWMTVISLESMTEEQRASVASFELAEKVIRIERETRQRLLEAELKKLRADVADSMRLFDHRLRQLLQQRLNVLKRIHREEHTMLSLVNDIVANFEVATLQVDNLFRGFAADLRNARANVQQAANVVKRTIAAHTKRHEALAAEERAIEKNFRRDCTSWLQGVTLTNHHGVVTPATDWTEYLFRLFKSRPTFVEHAPRPRAMPAAAAASNSAIPNLNLTGFLGGVAASSAATDRTGLASTTLNPLLGQAGARRRVGSVSLGASGSMSARSVRGARSTRLAGILDINNDLDSIANSSPGGLLAPLPRPISQTSVLAAEDEHIGAFEALGPSAASFSARPLSSHDKKRDKTPAGSSNLAYVIAKAHAQAHQTQAVRAAPEKERSDDPFDSMVQPDLDCDLGEFAYLPLDPSDCPFELQISDLLQDSDSEEEDDDAVHLTQYDADGNPMPRQAHVRSSSSSSIDGVPKPLRTYGNVWARLNERRALRFTKEIELRASGNVLAELSRALSYLDGQAESLNVATRDLSLRKSGFDDARTSLTLNTEVVLRMPQGLVEIEESPVATDMSDGVMIDRSWLDVLNARILACGRENVIVLREISSASRGIRSKQWERQRLTLLHADASDLTKELQLLRVTKSLQSLIKAGGQDNKSALEVSVMERKAEHLRLLTRSEIESRSKKLQSVKRKIRNSNAENERLGNSLVALHTLVEERKQIAQFNHNGNEMKLARERRMASIADRRHLLRLLEQQKQLMADLHAERDKLRAKTYPSFAVLSAKPPQFTLLPDTREELRPSPPANAASALLSSPRMRKTR